MSGDAKWTPAQQAAIEHEEGALLVSAAAGSGKTAVLAARCVHLVCDAQNRCDVDELLVLTFTRAAAGEMRERIERQLRKRVESDDDSRLQRQLRLIDRATITTLDGFCASLVRENFHLLGIDPGFSILAPEDAALLKAEVVDRLLDVEYDSPRAFELKSLLDGYFGGDDSRLRSHLIAANSLLQSVVDPQVWRDRALYRLKGGADGSDTELIDLFREMQLRALRSTRSKLAAARRFIAPRDLLASYLPHVDELLVESQDWMELAERSAFDALAARVAAFKAPRLPTIRTDDPSKETAKVLIDAGKEDLKDCGAAHAVCRWSLAQLRSDLAQIAPHAQYFLNLTDQFTDAYNQAKRDLRSLDFADTERLALVVLRDHAVALAPSTTARRLHHKFRHVLVDEFQDINPLQNSILRLASRDLAAEADVTIRSNFFTVGDVKQSIYRFRLAEPQQFIQRQAGLRAANSLGRVIDLQENFRSRGPLLEAVNDIFRLLMTGESTGIHYDQTQELKSITPYPDFGAHAFTGKPIELHLLPREIDRDPSGEVDEEPLDSFEREIALVATRIGDLIRERRVVAVKEGSTLVSRALQYGDIAVLLRSARFKSSQVADELRSKGIPVHADDSTGFFNVTEVQDVLSILRLIANQQQDIPMAAFLRSPIADLPSPEDSLARIRLAYADEPFHRAAVLYANEHSDDLARRLSRLLQALGNWRTRFQEQPIAESLSQFLDDTNYLTFCRALPDGAQRVANLGELRERAIAFDSFERQGLDRFLKFLEELEADDQLGRPSIAAATQDHVRVMTVHKSKGLEFPVVIVPDLGKRFNEQSLAAPILLDRDLGIGMGAVDLPMRVRYPSVASMVIKAHARRQAVAEEIRVLYVALTRAREHLILIGSDDSDFAQVAEQWAVHQGPLPDELIQRARTPLDWIAPIAAIAAHQNLGTFTVTDWKQQPLPSSDNDEPDNQSSRQLQRWFSGARSAASTEAAQAAIERITFRYPHLAATAEASTRRISELGLVVDAPVVNARIELEWPDTYRPRKRAGAMEIGTAIHRFMELIDRDALESKEAIGQQIQALVARQLISAEDAKLIDLDTVEWFANTELGMILRDQRNRLLREQAIAYSIRPPALDESDCVLVRGRLDSLIVTPEGLVLLDYKTDRVDATNILPRAESYWPQMVGYATAASKVARLPVVRASLVFLRARQIIDLPASMLATDGN